MKQISAKKFFSLCRGSRLIKVENVEGASGRYESTIFTYQKPDNDLLYKIETRGLRAIDTEITVAYYNGATLYDKLNTKKEA